MFEFLKRWFAHVQKVQTVEPKDFPPQVPLPEPSVPSNELTLSQATKVALKISSSFESHDGFSSVVGNFDGEGLTCGALGFTWKENRQQPLILKCQNKYPDCILKYMPTLGSNFLSYACMTVSSSLPRILAMTDFHGEVFPHVKKELEAFWGSEEMIQIQIEEAKVMALKAQNYASVWHRESGGDKICTLQEFVYFFDVLVQNGSMDGLGYESVQLETGNGILMAFVNVKDFCETNSNSDSKRNATLWESIFPASFPNHQKLLILAYLRAKQSNKNYSGSVINRRGAIAMMQGYVNGTLRDFHKEFPNLLTEIIK